MTFEDRLIATSYKGPGFDQTRLAAATIVLLHHCRGAEVSNVEIDPLFNYSGGYMQFGLLAVSIFFAISGFLVTPSLQRTGNVTVYAVHRAVRLMPALLVVVVLSMLVVGPLLSSISLHAYFSDPKLLLYLKNATTLSTYHNLPGLMTPDGTPIMLNGVFWTLHFEVLSYLALALLSLAGLLQRRSLFLAVTAVCYAIYIFLNVQPQIAAQLPDRFRLFIDLYVYFAGGAALFIYRDRVPFSAMLVAAAVAIVLVALPIGLGPVALPLCLPYVVAYCGLSNIPGKALFKRDLSYGVYLIHAPVFVALMIFFPQLRVSWPLVAAIVFPITLVLAYFSWTFVEEPALNRKKAIATWVSARVNSFLSSWSQRETVQPRVNK